MPDLDEKELLETNGYRVFGDSIAVPDMIFGIDIFKEYTLETLTNIVSHPMVNNEQLRKLSNRLYSANGLLTQAIDHITALPLLNHVVIPMGKVAAKRKKNATLMEASLRTLQHKLLARDVLHKVMIDGVAFYYCEFANQLPDRNRNLSDWDVETILQLNNINENVSALPLPPDYTKIVGRQNSVYVLAFNLEYFSQFDEERRARKLRMYPAEIRKGWESYKNRSSAIGNWLVLDYTKTIVVKIRSKMEEPWGRPLCLAAIKDILYDDYFKNTRRGVLDETNNKIIYQTLPPGQNNAVSSLTKGQQKAQHDAVKSAIMQKNQRNATSFFTVAAGTKIDKIETDTSVLDETNSSYITDQIGIDLGFMANLLSATNSGTYSAQQTNLQLLLSEVYMWLEQFAEEIIKVINKNIIKDNNYIVRVWYMPSSIITRTEFTNSMKDLYLQGKGSLKAWIASTGVDVEAYLALMDSEIEEDFENKYPVHKTSFTYSSNDKSGGKDKGGRPEEENPTNESTIQTRSNGGNDIPSPSDL